MPPDMFSRHNAAVARDRDHFALLALIIGVGLPATTVARRLPAPAGWPSWLTPVVLGAVVALVVARPVGRWTERRTGVPGRSTARYTQMFVAIWLVGLGVAFVGLAAARLVWPAAGSENATVAGAVLAALAPWAVVPAVERWRPAWVAHPAARAGADMPAA